MGLSYEPVPQGCGRELAAREGFPAPFLGRRWDADLVRAWRLARSGRRLTHAPAPRLAAPRPRGLIEDLRSA